MPAGELLTKAGPANPTVPILLTPTYRASNFMNWLARLVASSLESARKVTCPIFRPGLTVRFPYKWSSAPGIVRRSPQPVELVIFSTS